MRCPHCDREIEIDDYADAVRRDPADARLDPVIHTTRTDDGETIRIRIEPIGASVSRTDPEEVVRAEAWSVERTR